MDEVKILEKIADFADKVHSGKLVNEKGEKYTQVCKNKPMGVVQAYGGRF